MTIQRAVMEGLLAGVVQTRNIFTADVVPSGGDTSHVLWQAYLSSIITPISGIITSVWAITAIELQLAAAGHWEPFERYVPSWTITGAGDYLPNLVAFVLLGKASGLRHVGRKFFSGVIESAATANSLTTAALAAAASGLAAYITPFTGIGGGVITPGVTDSAGTFRPFIGGTVSSLLGSMRRRKPGLGI
jgi:hypothetical protein